MLFIVGLLLLLRDFNSPLYVPKRLEYKISCRQSRSFESTLKRFPNTDFPFVFSFVPLAHSTAPVFEDEAAPVQTLLKLTGSVLLPLLQLGLLWRATSLETSHACFLKTDKFVYGSHDLHFFYSQKSLHRCQILVFVYIPSANPLSGLEPGVMRKPNFRYISAPVLNNDKNPVEPKKSNLQRKNTAIRKEGIEKTEKWKKIKDMPEKDTAKSCDVINDRTGCKDQLRPNPILLG